MGLHGSQRTVSLPLKGNATYGVKKELVDGGMKKRSMEYK